MTATTQLPGADTLGEAAPGSPITGCPHPKARHTHGSRTGYVICNCRCPHCREASRAYEADRRRLQAYGRYDRLVDATPVRNHIQALSAQGMGWKNVADTAGVARSTVGHFLYGKYPDQPDHPEHRPPRRRVTRQVAEKLLAVQLDLADGASIPQAGTVRRLQALVACGWSMTQLATRLGWTINNGWKIIHGHRGQVTVATAAKVRALYDELWDSPPPETTKWERSAATRARNLAASWQWVRPLGWDDDTIDDPYAQPEPDTDDMRSGRVDLDEVRFLLDAGTSIHEIAYRMGVTPSGITQNAYRHGHPDLAAVFATANGQAGAA